MVHALTDTHLQTLHDTSSSSAIRPNIILTQLTWDSSLVTSAGEQVLTALQQNAQPARAPFLVTIADELYWRKLEWDHRAVRRDVDSWASDNIRRRQMRMHQAADLVLSGSQHTVAQAQPSARVHWFPVCHILIIDNNRSQKRKKKEENFICEKRTTGATRGK